VPLTVERSQRLRRRCGAVPGHDGRAGGLGRRIGELLALRVENVDFLRRTVRIEWLLTVGSRGAEPAEDAAIEADDPGSPRRA
jgi:integrase